MQTLVYQCLVFKRFVTNTTIKHINTVCVGLSLQDFKVQRDT